MRLTPRCRQVITLSQEGCQSLGHPQFTSAHLLLGLLGVEEGVARQMLHRRKITYATVAAHLSAHPPAAEPAGPERDDGLTPTVTAALSRAEAERERLGDSFLGEAHLFAGVLTEEKGAAARLLEALGVDRPAWLQEMRKELTRYARTLAAVPAASVCLPPPDKHSLFAPTITERRPL